MFVRLKIILIYTLGIRKIADIDGPNKLCNLSKKFLTAEDIYAACVM
jgi:hypothetical protein